MANSINTSKFNNKTKKILDRDTIEQSIINSNNKNLDGLDEEQKTELINDLVETELTKKHILNPDKIFEFNSDTQILTNKYPVKSNSPYNIDINAPDKYNDKLRPFFNYISGNINGHLKKNQTGNELIENAIELDIMFNHSSIDSKIKTSIEELINTANAIDTTDEYWVYDLETASGRNKYGYQELDDIQEISMKKYKKVIDSGNITRIIEDEKARIETVIGIDPDKAERYRKTLPNLISKKGFSSEKARIIAMRFAKYGHKNTEFDYGRNDGTVRINKFASDEDIEVLDIEELKKNIVRGIERFEKTYEVQQGYRMENGLSVQDDMVLSMINNINNDFTVGYNSRTFDNSILSTYASRMWRNMTPEQKFIYSEIYGFDEFRGPEILPKNNNHLDLLDLNRVLASANGKIDTIYNEDEIAKLSGLKGTLLQQEILGKIKVPNASATGSHTAGDDVNVLAHLVGSDIEGTGKSYLKTILEKAKNIEFDTSNINESSVLMTKQSSFFNDYNRKGFLNFSLDKRTGAIKTFNGVSLEADGSARDLGPLGKEFGLKKNTTYKINSVKKLNMTDEWQKLMKRFGYQDYERNNLVAVEFAPLIDENITDNEILEDPIFYIFNDIKEAEGFISGHVDNIGSIDPSTNELINSSSKEVAEKYARYVIDDNGVRKVADYDVKDLVAKSTMQRMNDPAARAVRSNNYTKNKNFLNVVKFFENNNVKAVEEQHKMLAMLTANEVAQGKALELNSQITQMLGYNDIQLNKKDLRSTTLSNFINSYKNYHSKRRLIEQVVKVVDTTPTQNNTEKQYIFENIMESFMTDIYEKANTNINAPLELYGKDLDYFEVNINGLFNKKHKNEILNETDDIFKINLKNGKEYSLVNDLLKRVYGNDKRVWRSKESRDTYGSKVLNDFIDVLKQNPEYKKILNGVNYSNEVNGIFDKIDSNKANRIAYKDKFFNNIITDFRKNADLDINELRENLINIRNDNRVNKLNKYYEIFEDNLNNNINENEVVKNLRNDIGNANKYRKEINTELNRLYGIQHEQNKLWNSEYKDGKTYREAYTNIIQNYIDTSYDEVVWTKMSTTDQNKTKWIHKVLFKERTEIEKELERMGLPYANSKKEINPNNFKEQLIEAEEKSKNINNSIEELHNKLYQELKTNKELSNDENLIQYGKYIENANNNELKVYDDLINKISDTKMSKDSLYDELQGFLSENTEDRNVLYNILKEKANKSSMIYKDINPDIKAERVIKAFQKHRAENPTSGFITAREYQNVLGEDKVVEAYLNNVSDDEILKEALIKKNNMPNYSFIDTSLDDDMESKVSEMVDKILMPSISTKNKNIVDIDEITHYASDLYGFTDNQTIVFKNAIKTARQELIQGYSDIFKAVVENGGSIAYNEKSKTAVMHMAGKLYNLDLMKIDIINGSPIGQIAGSKFSLGHMLNVSNAIKDDVYIAQNTKVTSNIAKAFEQAKIFKYSMNKATASDEKVNKFFSLLGMVNRTLREESYVEGKTIKDTFAFQTLNVKELYKALPLLADTMEQYDIWSDPKLINKIRKNKKALSKGKIPGSVAEAMRSDMQKIYNIAFGISPFENMPDLTIDQKLISMATGNVKDVHFAETDILGEFNAYPLLEYDNPNRPNMFQGINSKKYSLNDINKTISKHKDKLKNNDLDFKVRLKNQRNTSTTAEGVGEVVSEYISTVGKVSEIAYKKILKENKKAIIDKAPDHMKKAYAKAYEQLEGANLTEQAQITDGYVAELFFKDTEIQKINGRKQFINDTNVNTKVMQSRINAAMPKMKLKDGKLVFEYGVTSSVKRHDPILLKQGYANTIDVIGAKEALGKFGFAYSAKGTDIEINEDKITEILNENINNLLKDNGEIDSEKAYSYLDEIFNPYFYVKNTIQKGYHKSSSEVVEKHMTESATSGMGTLNDNIKNFLKVAKGKDGKNLSNLIGINYNDDTLNDVISQAFNSLSEDKKSSLGFNTSSDLFEAIEEEKYLKSNILFRQIEAFKGLSSIGLDDELKHRSAGLKAREFIKTLAYAYTKEDGLTDEEAYKKVAQQLSDFKVFEDLDIQSKDGSIIFGQVNDNNLRVDNFTKLKNTIFENKNYKKHFIRETLVNNEKESIAFAIARNSSSFNVDYSGTSRSYSNAEELKAEKNKLILNLKKENLSVTEKDAIEDKIKDLDYRISIDLNNNKTMKITSRERDLMDANRYSDESFEKLKSRLLTSSEQNTNHPLADLYNTYFKRLEDPTGALSNDYNNKSVYSSLLDQYTKLHDIKMKNSREYTNSLGRAQLFNNGDMDAEHLLTKDYSKKHISDIVMPTGEGSNFLIDNPNSLFGKNMILETSTGKQIAVPKMPYKIYNDEVMMNEVTKAVSSLQNAEDTLHSAIMNGSHTEINKLKTSVNDKADNLKSVLDATTRNYLKYLDTTELTDVDYKKVNASIYMKGANNFSGYNTAKIDIGGGKMMSLGELAENDVHVAATWHGRDYFQDYLDNWEKYKDLGISSQEDMVDHLKTKGIIAQDDRYPNIRPFSTGPQRQFLSDDVKPGVAISTGVDMIRKKQDQDGDSKHFARIKYQEFDENGDVSYSSSRLEFDLKMQSDKYRDSVSQREIDYWNNIDSGIMHDAVISNRQGYRSAIARMEKENTIAKSLINIEDILNNAAEYENGPITPFIQNKDGIATLKNYERTIKSLEKEVLSQNKSYETMEHGDKVRTLTKHIESNYTGDKLKEYTKALTNVNMIAKEQEMIAAKAGKKVVGEVNVPLYGLKRVAMSQKYDSRTIQNLINLTYAVEEGNISKKSTNSAGLSLTERIKTSIDDIVNGRAQGSKNLEGIIRGDLREDLLKYTKEISAFPNINSMSDDDIIEESVKTVRFIGNEFIDKPNLKLGFETAIAPYKTTRHNMSTVLSGMSQIKDSTAEYLDDDLKNLLSVPASELNMGAFTRTSSKINRELAESAALEITHGLQGTGLAKTALGLAAAIMVTGYIGGNPTKPAEDQAEELSNDSYDSLQDEDLSIQKLPGGTGQGYVININAQSERGKEHVQEAIQKAMYSSITTDVNISMNIKDKTSNINSRFIDKLLTGVL